jgi:hypothetical protein
VVASEKENRKKDHNTENQKKIQSMDWEIKHSNEILSWTEINDTLRNDVFIYDSLKSKVPNCLVEIISNYLVLFPEGIQITGISGGLFDLTTLSFLVTWMGWYENLLPSSWTIERSSRQVVISKYPECKKIKDNLESPIVFLYPELKSKISFRLFLKLVWLHFGSGIGDKSEKVNPYIPPLATLMRTTTFFVNEMKQSVFLLGKTFYDEKNSLTPHDLTMTTENEEETETKSIRIKISVKETDDVDPEIFTVDHPPPPPLICTDCLSSIFKSLALETQSKFRTQFQENESRKRTISSFQRLQKHIFQQFHQLGIPVISVAPSPPPVAKRLFPGYVTDNF